MKGAETWYHHQYGITKIIDRKGSSRGDNRIQYAPKARSYGVVPCPTREKKDGQYEFFHYHVILIGTRHYPDGSRENMESTIVHENRHVKQFLQMRTNGQDGLMPNGSKPKNVWKGLVEEYEQPKKDDHFGALSAFVESDAYMEGIISPHSDWLKKQNSFKQFQEAYHISKRRVSEEEYGGYIQSNELRASVRRLLQVTYLACHMGSDHRKALLDNGIRQHRGAYMALERLLPP